MPFASINEAQIYYETFGQDAPGRAPVLLIHSATRTGHATWGHAAPRLAERYRVIVPDCRGHGLSSNPSGTYSFKEMAADAVGLLRELGYRRAHIIGHSNGGNVALVTLIEHPEVVQACVIQAGNAWVSPDLIEREPPVFEPERIAREDPQWMAEMVALRGATHGPDYWRELVRITVAETIREPKYEVAVLKKVSRPVLVIEGEQDGVNATSAHAKFIADNIPAAELWRPAGVGNHVHDEVLDEWLDRVLDFLARRGGDPL